MLTPAGPFDYERHALRWVLKRLLGEVQDLEVLCKFVPRIATAVSNIARVETALKSSQPPPEMTAFQIALRELIEERSNNEEET